MLKTDTRPRAAGQHAKAKVPQGQSRRNRRHVRPPGWREVAIGVALVAALLAVLWWTLAATTRDPSMVELEFAGDATVAQKLLHGANAQTIAGLRSELLRDVVLTLAYVATLGFWCWYGSRHLRRHPSRQIAKVLLYGVGVAALASLVGIAALDRVIDARGDNNGAAIVATAAAIPKWLILLAAVPEAAVVLAGAVARVGRRARRSVRNGKFSELRGVTPSEPAAVRPDRKS